jgi:asparagine synthase (glutamine-hydrolysing)
MCGICGELKFRDRPVLPGNIEAMMNAIVHRGPDDSGLFCEGIVGLGHRRLSILDLSTHGRQPIWSNNGSLCIVFNGEVYNFKEIKKELEAQGYRFSSTTDTEVVVNSIEFYGIEKALSMFIGMFGFALWDCNNKTLYLCRDRVGIKPLYYYLGDEHLLFGSELKALMAHPSYRKELNPKGVGQFFITGYTLDNETVFRNTYKLTPGTYLVIDSSGRISSHKYWGLDYFQRNSWRGSFDDACEHLEELLTSAFRYRLVSDVPVGLFLSGGIDSSLLSAVISKRLEREILNITIGFREQEYNEVPKAELVAKQLGVHHIVHYVDGNEAQNILLDFPEIYDEPFGDTSGIPTYILSKIARQHVKVALSADGGDEQFCGYESYVSYKHLFSRINRAPSIMRSILGRALRHVVPYKQLLSFFMRTSNAHSRFNPQYVARYEKMMELFKVNTIQDMLILMNEKAWTHDTVEQLIPCCTGNIFSGSILSEEYMKNQHGEPMDLMMRMDFEGFLRDDILTKVDRASMAVSLECRDPMLDHRIAELAFSLPFEYLYHQGEHKRILKSLLRKWISEDVVSFPKKGFMIPLYTWMKGVWKPIVLEYLSPEKVKAVGVLDPKEVAREVDQFYRYHGCRAEKLWMMLNFHLWADRWYLN